MIFIVVLCCAFSFRLAYYLSERELSEQRIRTDTALRNMALVAAANIESAFQKTDSILRFLQADWENGGAISPIYRQVLDETLKAGMIDVIFVADRAGDIVFSTEKIAAKSANIAETDYFQRQLTKDTGQLLISSAISQDGEGRTTLFVSRRLNQPNGAFNGIIVAEIRQDYLLGIFRDMELGEDNSLSLLHTSGSILARIPGEYDKNAFAAVFRNHPSLAPVSNGAIIGEYQVPGADGIPRFGSFRKLSGYPVIALATVKKEAAFQNVVARQSLYRKVATAFSFIIIIATFLLWLQLRKQYRNEIKLRNQEKELNSIVYHDALTGIYNRAYFYEKFKVADRQTAVIIADLDSLKIINDAFGHQKGDQVLKDVARIMEACIPPDAFVARIGGDEFAVVLTQTAKDGIKAICQLIRDKISDYNCDHSIPIQLSLGFALAEDKAMGPEELLAVADKWMYRRKMRQSGTHRSQFTNILKEMLVARDYITEGHASRVVETTIALAKAAGISSTRIPDIELFAYFHDIGKVGVSDTILNKEGLLTDQERQEIQQHSDIGHRIASTTDDLSVIAGWILKHHERWDGQGYPLGIAGDDIPIECRILAITDAYDAMTSDRPYRKAMTSAEAIDELRRNAGTQFDPDLVAKFVEIIRARTMDRT